MYRNSSNSNRDKKNLTDNKQPLRTFGEWSEFLSSGGKIYFYNCKTEKTQWEKPEEWDWLVSQEERNSKGYYPGSSSSSSSNKDYNRNDYNRHRNAKYDDPYDSPSYQKRPSYSGSSGGSNYDHKSYSREYSSDYKQHQHSHHHHNSHFVQSMPPGSASQAPSVATSQDFYEHGDGGPNSTGFHSSSASKDHHEAKSWNNSGSNFGAYNNSNYRPKSSNYSSKSYRDDEHLSKSSPRYNQQYSSQQSSNNEDSNFSRQYSQSSRQHVSRYDSYTEGSSSHDYSGGSKSHKKEPREYSRTSSRSSSENNRSPSSKKARKSLDQRSHADESTSSSSNRNSKSPSSNASKAASDSHHNVATNATIKEEETESHELNQTTTSESSSKVEDPRLQHARERALQESSVKTEDGVKDAKPALGSANVSKEFILSQEDINKYYRQDLVQQLINSLGFVENMSIVNQPYLKQLACTNIAVELKNYRSIVRIKEIKKTLQQQRLDFLESHMKNIEEILN